MHEANLSTATDEEWLEAHARLTEEGAAASFPQHELTFVWDPDLDPQSLIDENEIEVAPHG